MNECLSTAKMKRTVPEGTFLRDTKVRRQVLQNEQLSSSRRPPPSPLPSPLRLPASSVSHAGPGPCGLPPSFACLCLSLAGAPAHGSEDPFQVSKAKIWTTNLPAWGGQVVQLPAASAASSLRTLTITHVLVRGGGAAELPRALLAAAAAPAGTAAVQAAAAAAAQKAATGAAGSPAAASLHVVHYTWLEQCLLHRRRLPEAEFHPAVLLSAAHGEEWGWATQPAEGSSPPGLPAAAAAAAASSSAATPVLRISAPRLGIVYVQAVLLHLLLGGPSPHGLARQGPPHPCVLLLLVPGLDWAAWRGKGGRLPRMRRLFQQALPLGSPGGPDVAHSTLLNLVSVPHHTAGAKRKQPESEAEAGAGEGSTPSSAAAHRAPGGPAQGPVPEGPELGGTVRFPPAFFLASERQIRLAGYPLPLKGSGEEQDELLPLPGFQFTDRQQRQQRQQQQQGQQEGQQRWQQQDGQQEQQPLQ